MPKNIIGTNKKKNMKKNIIYLLLVLAIICTSNIIIGQQNNEPKPEIGKTKRYCNSLPMITAPGSSASGDVTVIRESGKYYMFCTGGGAWISDDMLNWSFQKVDNVPIAPHIVKYNGSFYMCGNDGPLYKADNPLGHGFCR